MLHTMNLRRWLCVWSVMLKCVVCASSICIKLVHYHFRRLYEEISGKMELFHVFHGARAHAQAHIYVRPRSMEQSLFFLWMRVKMKHVMHIAFIHRQIIIWMIRIQVCLHYDFCPFDTNNFSLIWITCSFVLWIVQFVFPLCVMGIKWLKKKKTTKCSNSWSMNTSPWKRIQRAK